MLNRTFFLLIFSISCIFTARSSYDMDEKSMIMKTYDEQYNIIDTTSLQIIFAHIMYDTVLDYKDIKYDILSIGRTCSQYRNYGNYREDSVLNSRAGEKYSPNYGLKLFKALGCTGEMSVKNFRDSTYYHVDIMTGQSYCYTEPLPVFQWKLEPDTTTVLGHICHKATTSWRGRDWTAWYSDIPHNDGPAKFSGLPGLILKMTDASGDHEYRALGIKKDVHPIGTYRDSDPIRMKRERFNALYEDHKVNFGKMFSTSGLVDMTPEKKAEMESRRLFFCPLELE